MKIITLWPLFRLFALLFLNFLFSFSGIANSPFSKKSDLTITVTAQVTETFCNACVGSVDLTVSGGQMPYVFNWNNGATTEDLADLCLGFYEVTVTDASGCTFEEGYFVGNTTIPDVILESQAEVDDYVANFSFCTSVPNTLRIGTTFANPPSDISDISGLSFITSVGGPIFIFQNPNLTSLNGLQGITSAGSTINITNNDGLTNLSGFPSINAIDGNLTIDNCANLISLEGLNSITSIDGDVYLSNTTDLTSLSALSNLQTVNGELDIRICLDLQNFNGLENLTTIGGDLTIRDNIVLNDISALDHPIAIGGNLEIQNTNLSNCSILPICEMLNNGASAALNNNNTDCNTVDQILLNCATDAILITLSSPPLSCFDLCNGTITVTVDSGGTPPFQYSWSTGVVTNFPILPGLCAGDYSVTVTDANGLTVSGSFELTGPDPIETIISVMSTECYQSCGFELDFETTGGTPPYEYSGLPNEICVNTNYVVFISDANNCGSEQSFSIPFMEPPNFVLDETGDDINGQSTGYFNISVSGGIGPFTYEWYLGGMLVSTDEDPTGLAAGAYTLVLNDDGCILEFGPFIIDAITGIADLDDQLIRVFPIPAKEYIRVQFEFSISEKVPYTLWNSSGALMRFGQVLNSGFIDLNGLGSGVYFLKIKIGEEIMVRKLIIL